MDFIIENRVTSVDDKETSIELTCDGSIMASDIERFEIYYSCYLNAIIPFDRAGKSPAIVLTFIKN